MKLKVTDFAATGIKGGFSFYDKKKNYLGALQFGKGIFTWTKANSRYSVCLTYKQVINLFEQQVPQQSGQGKPTIIAKPKADPRVKTITH